MEKRSNYLISKNSILNEDCKTKLIKEIITQDIPLLNLLKPKIENYINVEKIANNLKKIYKDETNNHSKNR